VEVNKALFGLPKMNYEMEEPHREELEPGGVPPNICDRSYYLD